MKLEMFRFALISVLSILLGAISSISAAVAEEPLKVLLITSGGYHDYETLGPFLAKELQKRINGKIDWKKGLELLKDPDFAKDYDAVIYDVCDDEAPDEVIDNVLKATSLGKATVMIHCSIHAFRRSPKVSEWEGCCGLKSKFHDPYSPLTVQKIDADSAITSDFPDNWKTIGDELYQNISIEPKSRPLLKVKSPHDGREHVVCWTIEYGKGRVFSTTLGHDMKTTSTPEYLQLVANGLKWTCKRLNTDIEKK
jgi:type 1 glutamine amidotransferase